MPRTIVIAFCIGFILTVCASISGHRHIVGMLHPQHHTAPQNELELVTYEPLSQQDWQSLKDSLGLRYCPHDGDYLAGAAKACGHITNLPTGQDLQRLAQLLYHQQTDDVSIYGKRDDEMMKAMNIWFDESHIYYWAQEEAKDQIGGYVRMFADAGSLQYYAYRDGQGYISRRFGKLRYNLATEAENPATGDNEQGVLLTICYKPFHTNKKSSIR